jgi:hypothetical protein
LKPDNSATYLILANIHINRRDYQSLKKDLDAYLKLVPNGPEAEQARKMRDDLQAAAQQAENQVQTEAQRKSQPAEDAPRANIPPPAEVKELPPPPEPDSSGLPSLPPPSPENQ